MATTILGPHYDRHDRLVRVASVIDFLIEARRTDFVRFIESITNPFFAPFRGILPSETLDGTHPIAWSIVAAFVAYLLLHGVVRALLRLIDRA